MTLAYVITNLDITDEEKFKEYQQATRVTLEPYQARPLIVSQNVEIKEGEWSKGLTVVLEFPSMNHAQDWYHSDEYQKVIPLRLASSRDGRLIITEGFVG